MTEFTDVPAPAEMTIAIRPTPDNQPRQVAASRYIRPRSSR